jgi:hypothetical protein
MPTATATEVQVNERTRKKMFALLKQNEISRDACL